MSPTESNQLLFASLPPPADSMFASLPPPADAAAVNAFYREHGFYFVPALLSPDEVQEVHMGIDALVANETASVSLSGCRWSWRRLRCMPRGYHPHASERALLSTNS